MNGSADGQEARAPLSHIRIADLSQAWAGAYATQILGDLGAEVIKVESRRRPDPWRGGLAAYQRGKGEPGNRPYNRHPLTNSVCRNKLGITLDLGTERGRELFLRLVAISDVVVENFTPRVMKNLGLGFDVLCAARPDLIMLAMPGYGDYGPYSDFPGIGGSIEPMSGNSALLGPPDGAPVNSGVMYPDPIAALFGASAVLTALRARARGTAGQYINLSQHESMISLMGGVVLGAELTGAPIPRRGDQDPDAAPSGNYRCRDGRFVAITVEHDRDWFTIAACMGHPDLRDDARFATGTERLRRRDEVNEIVAAWCAERDADEVERLLAEHGLAAGIARSLAEVADCPQLRSRGFFETVGHTELGAYETAGIPWRLSGTPAAIRHGPPCLGEHSREVLQTLLGLSLDEVLELEAAGITGDQPPEV